MTLPVVISLIDEDKLKIEPVDSFKTLRYNHKHIENLQLSANKEVILKGIRGNSLEIIAEIETQNTLMLEINLLKSINKEEFTRILFFKRSGYPNRGRISNLPEWHPDSVISIDNSYSSLSSDVIKRPSDTASFTLAEGETLKLHIFIDRSIIEIFINTRQRIVIRVYPTLKEAVEISFYSHGQPSLIKSLDAWQMKSIWE